MPTTLVVTNDFPPRIGGIEPVALCDRQNAVGIDRHHPLDGADRGEIRQVGPGGGRGEGGGAGVDGEQVVQAAGGQELAVEAQIGGGLDVVRHEVPADDIRGVGAGLLGIIGALLAIPTAAAVLLLVREVWTPRQEAR